MTLGRYVRMPGVLQGEDTGRADKERVAGDRARLPSGATFHCPGRTLSLSSPTLPGQQSWHRTRESPWGPPVWGSRCSGLADRGVLACWPLQLCSLPLPTLPFPSTTFGAGNGAKNTTVWPWPPGMLDVHGRRCCCSPGSPRGTSMGAAGAEKEGMAARAGPHQDLEEGAFQGRRGSNTKPQGRDLLGGLKGQNN